jgi:hypothetical protein
MMLITEEEARTKWCPFSDPTFEDRHYPVCLGSMCMAWRSEGKRSARMLFTNEAGNLDTAIDPGVTPTSPPRGFCGLAGKPY